MSANNQQSSDQIIQTLISEVPSNMKLIVAVSGGIDSTALLVALNEIKITCKLELIVAHVDHQLRQKSETDALFVSKLAKELSLEFVKKICEDPPKVNIESWARQQRYDFFKDLMSQHQADYLVTAHHAGDLVETLLIKLLQNRELNLMQSVDSHRKLLRPLLNFQKKDLESFLVNCNQGFVEDSTNQDDKFLRNRIRHQLLPFLDKINDCNASKVLRHQAEVVHELNRLADEEVRLVVSELPLINLGEPLSTELVEVILNFREKSWLLAAKAIDQAFLPVYGFYLGQKIAERVIRVLSREEKSYNLPEGKSLILCNGDIVLKSQKT